MGIEFQRGYLTKGSAAASIRWRSGYYYTTTGVSSSATAAPPLNTMRCIALDVPYPMPIDRIGVEITSAGGAGSVVRLGVYKDDGTGLPGALLFDAGAGIDGTSTGGPAITVSQTLPQGRVWLAYVAQVGTVPTCRGVVIGTQGIDIGTTPSGTNAQGYQSGTSVSGALPASFGTPTSAVVPPKIAVRVA